MSLKVLKVHCYYKNRGGEDESFDAEVDLLRANGHEVVTYTRKNDEVDDYGRLKLASTTIWNQQAQADVAEIIKQHRPQVMHCTNLFPLISPSIYSAAKSANVAVVQALRNYRLLCANASLYRDGKVCEQCVGKKAAWNSIVHGCYRESRLASGVVTAMQAIHRVKGTWSKMVDHYYTPSEFTRQKFVDVGFQPERISVKPNFISPDPGVGSGQGGFALFVGRLSSEKGIELLLNQWQDIGETLPLKIVGTGPLEGLVATAAEENAAITFEGFQAMPRVLELIGQATCIVMPSLWYETFGRVILEAFAKGTPAIVTNLGAMAELVNDGESGLLFDPHSPGDLAAKVKRLATSPELQRQMGQAARLEYETRFTASVNYPVLREIYERAIHATGRCSEANYLNAD